MAWPLLSGLLIGTRPEVLAFKYRGMSLHIFFLPDFCEGRKNMFSVFWIVTADRHVLLRGRRTPHMRAPVLARGRSPHRARVKPSDWLWLRTVKFDGILTLIFQLQNDPLDLSPPKVVLRVSFILWSRSLLNQIISHVLIHLTHRLVITIDEPL